jgi:polyvinyl alcohol dehydrogenase (cytochrome)
MGARRFHPAGVPIWNSPTIDEKRGVLYVGTGESYTSPAVSTSDSVLAIGLDDGAIKWHYQALSGDAWNMACFIGGGPNCPEENGPDLDIGAPPILIKTKSGKEIIAVGQKSGDVFALDPDNNGALLWREKMGRGGFSGGVHWGIASNNNAIFAPIADTAYSESDKALSRAGLYALDPISGETLWATQAVDVCEEKDEPACDPGLSAAVTATKDMVFAGAFDGHLRAYDALNGDIIWDFNTNKEFVSVNGEIAKGGAIESDGPIIYDGHVIVNSGYSFGSMMPGNALLVFSTD